MEEELFVFSPNIIGCPKRISFTLPIDNGYAISSQYRPNLQNQNFQAFVGTHAGELDADFYNDCSDILNMAEQSSQTGMDAITDGILGIIKAHIQRCGRLIFGDLLIYVDCFVHIIRAAGVKEDVLKEFYMVELSHLVRVFLPYIKDDMTLIPFEQTHSYEVLMEQADELSMRLNGVHFMR